MWCLVKTEVIVNLKCSIVFTLLSAFDLKNVFMILFQFNKNLNVSRNYVNEKKIHAFLKKMFFNTNGSYFEQEQNLLYIFYCRFGSTYGFSFCICILKQK